MGTAEATMAADIFSDPARMEQLVEQVEDMARNVDRIVEMVARGGRSVEDTTKNARDDVEDIKRSFKEVEKSAEKTKRHISEWAKSRQKMKDEVSDIMALWEDAGPIRKLGISLSVALEGNYSKFDAYRTKLDEKHKDFQKRLWRQVLDARGKTGDIGDVLGLSGSRGAGNMLRTKVMDLTRGLPAGGIIGMMLMGAQQHETLRAKTASIVRVFDQIGGASRNLRRSVAGDVSAFHRMFGEVGPELEATLSAFTKAGAAQEAATRIGPRGKGPMAYKIATALDMERNLSPGTSASSIGTVMASTGEGVGSITKQLMALRSQADKTGVSYAALLGTLTQGVSVMRMQGQGVEDLTKLYSGMHKGFREMGMSKVQAGQAALKGVEGITSGFGSLSEGFLGFLAQRVGGESGDPFDRMMEYKLNLTPEGMVGKGRDKALTTALEIQEVINERFSGHSFAGKIGAGAKLTGLGEEQVRAILALRKDSAEGFDKVKKAFTDPMKLLHDSINNKLTTIDESTLLMTRLQRAMGDIGLSILSHTILMGNAIVSILHTPLTDFEKRDNIMGNYLRISNAANARFTGGVASLKDALGAHVGAMLGGVTEAMSDLTVNPNIAKDPQAAKVHAGQQALGGVKLPNGKAPLTVSDKWQPLKLDALPEEEGDVVVNGLSQAGLILSGTAVELRNRRRREGA